MILNPVHPVEFSGKEEVNRIDEVAAQVAAIDDSVQHPMLEEKFGPLEALGQLLADCLFYDTRARKSDLCPGLVDYQVIQHGIACGDPAGCRVGYNGYDITMGILDIGL